MIQNKYNQSFPQLMKGKKIMYVHGFASSAQSGTVELLRTLMPGAEIIAEDLPVSPGEAMNLLRELCTRHSPDLIIGSSMGGMMAEQLRGFDRILVNPAFEMGETMRKNSMIGKQVFQNPRKDGIQEFIVTKALQKEYADLTAMCFDGIDDKERSRVYGLFGDKDPVVHTFGLFSTHYPNAIRFHGEHRLIDKVAIHYLIPIIRRIDDRQDNRQRPAVYIMWDAMTDAYGKALPSLRKCFETLLENYRVYIVCPAPAYDHAFYADKLKWVEEELSAPAFDHVIFTNQPEALYGEYAIGRTPCADLVSGTVEFGSDTFKTWDDVIAYFGQLGGQ